MWAASDQKPPSGYMAVPQDGDTAKTCPEEMEPPQVDTIALVLRELRIKSVVKGTDSPLSTQKIWSNPLDLDPSGCCALWVRFGTVPDIMLYNALRLLVLADLIFVPWSLAFAQMCALQGTWQVVIVDFVLGFFCFFLSVPMCLQTSTISLKKGTEITDPWELYKHLYHSREFRADVLAAVASPCLYLGSAMGDTKGSPLRFLGLIRLCRIHHLMGSRHRNELLGNPTLRFLYVKGVGGILVAAHIFGCIWFYAKLCSPLGMGGEWTYWNGWASDATTLDGVANSLLSVKMEPGPDNCAVHYIRSVKDAVFMIASWGGPDALSVAQKIAILIVGPGSLIVGALSFDYFMTLHLKENMKDEVYNIKASMVFAACLGLQLPIYVNERVQRFHSYLHINEMNKESHTMLFTGLSLNLVAEVKLHCLRSVLRAGSFFEGLPPRQLSFLVVSFVETCCSPGEVIVRKNEMGDAMYVVLRGSMIVSLDEHHAQIVKHLVSGSVFGEISLIFPFPRTAYVFSATYTALMQLTKAKFDEILDASPDEKQVILQRIVSNFKKLQADVEHDVSAKTDEEQSSGLLQDLHLHISTAVDIADSLLMPTEGQSARELQFSGRNGLSCKTESRVTLLPDGVGAGADSEWGKALKKSATSHNLGSGVIGLRAFNDQAFGNASPRSRRKTMRSSQTLPLIQGDASDAIAAEQLFKDADTDNSGHLDSEELAVLVRKLQSSARPQRGPCRAELKQNLTSLEARLETMETTIRSYLMARAKRN